ncbi:MAG TPA: LPXTG cell wall anchor domain-containing protein [Gemmataceae bacterium]|nr:LPXTG cell wall anchor domain-containing protein [Gemmataceae bacterium]
MMDFFSDPPWWFFLLGGIVFLGLIGAFFYLRNKQEDD